jgi:hypothetical protein
MSVPLEVTIGKCSPMQLSVSATPSGISAQTSQASVSATGQYYLYLGVANTVAPESTTITVTGTCGLGSASTSVQLQTLACMPQACWSGECGAADDGCGHTIQCGGCPTGQSCVNHACVTPGGGNCGTPQQCCTKNGCRWSSGHCICI